MSSKSIQDLVKSHCTLIKMFRRRGDGWWAPMLVSGKKANIPEPEDDQDLVRKASSIRETNFSIIEDRRYSEANVMKGLSGLYGDRMVYFVTSLNNGEAQKALGLASEQKINKITIVWTQTQTAPSKPFIEQAIRATSVFFETFYVLNLAFDLTEHRLVPKHRLVSDPSERAEILEGYSLTEETISQLPVLLPHDPVAKYYAFPLGSIVEVTRPLQLGPVLVHRVVGLDTSSKTENTDYDSKLYKRKAVPPSERRYSNYMTPPEYTMAIARTAADIARGEPPEEYLKSDDLRLLKLAKKIVDDQASDVVISRAQINSNKEEHWHLSEMILPKVT